MIVSIQFTHVPKDTDYHFVDEHRKRWPNGPSVSPKRLEDLIPGPLVILVVDGDTLSPGSLPDLTWWEFTWFYATPRWMHTYTTLQSIGTVAYRNAQQRLLTGIQPNSLQSTIEWPRAIKTVSLDSRRANQKKIQLDYDEWPRKWDLAWAFRGPSIRLFQGSQLGKFVAPSGLAQNNL